MSKPRPSSGEKKLGFLTKEQFLVLKERAEGFTQTETAKRLRMTRANVSMLELRARRNVERANETLRAYESTLSEHALKIERGTRLQQIPSSVFSAGDRYGIHVRANLIEIIDVLRSLDPSAVEGTRTSRELTVTLLRNGRISIS